MSAESFLVTNGKRNPSCIIQLGNSVCHKGFVAVLNEQQMTGGDSM